MKFSEKFRRTVLSDSREIIQRLVVIRIVELWRPHPRIDVGNRRRQYPRRHLEWEATLNADRSLPIAAMIGLFELPCRR